VYPTGNLGWAPRGTHPGAQPFPWGRSAPVPAGRGLAYIKLSSLEKTCLGYLQRSMGRCTVGAIFGRCRLVSSLDAAASCPQRRPGGCNAELAAPQPRRTGIPPSLAPHHPLLFFSSPLLFFPADCEEVQSACDRFSPLPSPFLLVKTAILEQPGGLVKGYL